MALRAFAQFLLETPGLIFDLSLDDLPSEFVAHEASEAFELRELGVSGEAVTSKRTAEPALALMIA
jgi:hypothetical protein